MIILILNIKKLFQKKILWKLKLLELFHNHKILPKNMFINQ